jgi:putative peptidoglycan lipid II flippase
MEDKKISVAEENRSAAKATGKIGIAVMLSRVLGLVREVMLGAVFDGSRLNDCFVLAFRIPNLLRDLFAEGALSQAFVTTFSKRIKEDGEESAWELANRVLSLAVIFMSCITILGIICAPWLVDLLISEKNPLTGEQRDLTILMVRVMYPFILLVSLSALVMGMLNAKNVFGMPALASCFFNLGSMIGGGVIGYWLDPQWGWKSLLGISIGVLIGGLAQLVVQFPALWKIGFRPRWDTLWSDRGVKKIIKLMGPAMIAASAVQVNVMVNSSFAQQTGDGAVSWLNWAFRLMQLPIGMFGVAVATITLPALSRACINGISSEFRPVLARGMNLVAILVLPCAIGLAFLAEPIVSMVFQHGKFSHNSVVQTAAALQCYAGGLLFYSWIKIIQPAFYAIDRRWIPMLISFIAMGLNYVLNWYFVEKLGWGHKSLAITTSVLAALNFFLLYLFLRKLAGGLQSAKIFSTLWRCLIAAGVMAEVCWIANHYLLNTISEHTLLIRWLMGLPVIGTLAALYFGLCYVLGVREARDCLGMILRRIPGLKKFAPK